MRAPAYDKNTDKKGRTTYRGGTIVKADGALAVGGIPDVAGDAADTVGSSAYRRIVAVDASRVGRRTTSDTRRRVVRNLASSDSSVERVGPLGGYAGGWD